MRRPSAGSASRLLPTALVGIPCLPMRRSPEVRASLLDKGAEALLRQVKCAYPSCAEAGAAALRDLGLENYNS